MKTIDVVKELDKSFPNPMCELLYNNDYELVLSTMLSAQTTDKRVNLVMQPIYKKYNTLQKLNELTIEEISSLISSIGLYKNKAKYFKEITKKLIKYKKVPNNRELLENIPGLGRKSVNVILSVLYNEPFIAVDTHVNRVSKRLEICNSTDDVSIVEKKLYKFFKGYDYKRIGQQLVLFGRYKCTSKKPCCFECSLYDECNAKDKLKKAK